MGASQTKDRKSLGKLDRYTCHTSRRDESFLDDPNAACFICDDGTTLTNAQVMERLGEFWKQVTQLSAKEPNQPILATVTCASKSGQYVCPNLFFRCIPEDEGIFTIDRLEHPIVHDQLVPAHLKAVWAKHHNPQETETYPVCHRYSSMSAFELILLKQFEKGYKLKTVQVE